MEKGGSAHARLDPLFRPRSVALIGASADAGKTAGRPLRFLRASGFAGTIWPVNPRHSTLDGLPCFPDVASLPDAPDVGLVLVGAERAETAVRALARRGAAAAIVLAGGYAEVGTEGARRQEALRTAAGSMRLLGPNTIGLVNLADGITLSASGALDVEGCRSGPIAVVSQSGGILGSLLSRAAFRGIGLSRLVATGNEADLDVCDLMEWLLDDAETAAIALYLEGLRRPNRFLALAREALRRGKPLVAYKVGRSAPGARASQSHTGALAGEDRLYDALFAQAGVIRVSDYGHLLDTAMALGTGRRLHGRRLAILTSTGGAGGLVADACGVKGFDTPPPSPQTAARLAALLSHQGFAADRNPIDLTLAGLTPAVVRGAVAALGESDGFDAVIAIVGSSGIGRPDLVATPVIDSAAVMSRPLLVYTSPMAPEIVRRLNTAGVPAFDAPESCAAALDALFRAAHPPTTADAAIAPVPPPLPSHLAGLRGPLNEAEAKALFAAFGIPPVREAVARDAEEAGRLAPALGARVVVKVLSRTVMHKSEAGGVRIGVPAADASRACCAMAAAFPGTVEGFLVQEQVEGVEMIVGFMRDPQLGPAILVGAGGVAAELYDDTAVRLLPVGPQDVAAMLAELELAPLLTGFRGRPPADVAALERAVLAFSTMAAALGDRLVEAEINPLFVLPVGQGVRCADAVAVLVP